jgi:Ser-tRNA(Ala) deacylase AlaX
MKELFIMHLVERLTQSLEFKVGNEFSSKVKKKKTEKQTRLHSVCHVILNTFFPFPVRCSSGAAALVLTIVWVTIGRGMSLS